MKPPELSHLLGQTRCALMLVDVQNEFCHPEGAFGQKGVDLSAIGRMMPPLRALVASAREKAVPVVFIRNTEDEGTDSPAWKLRPDAREDSANEGVCRRGTWGAELYEFEPRPGELVLEKHRFSAFVNTHLDQTLKSRGIETLVLSGVASNVCVETTARHAIMLDYHVVVAEDACANWHPDLHAAAMKNLRLFVGKVADAAEIIELWG